MQRRGYRFPKLLKITDKSNNEYLFVNEYFDFINKNQEKNQEKELENKENNF
jgi:hypothetical protein